MPINFPNSPSPNQLYTYDNKTWEWNGIYWEVYSALTSYITSAYTVGNGVSDISGVTGGNIVLKSFSGVNITIIDGGDKLTFSSSTTNSSVSGNYLPLSGGTLTGGLVANNGITANTISATDQVGIGTGVSIERCAALEILSTTGGVLFPRMSEEERDSIPSPVSGLIVYVTDKNEGLFIYKTSGWVQII